MLVKVERVRITDKFVPNAEIEAHVEENTRELNEKMN